MAELTIEQLKAENATLKAENDKLKTDIEKAQEFIEKQKAENEKLKVVSETVGGSPVHKHGSDKYKLLFPVKLNGVLVTNEAIQKDKKLLEALVKSESGAIEKVQ